MKKFLIVICFVVTFWSCQEEDKSQTNSVFQIVSSKTSGLEFSNDLGKDINLNIVEYLYYYNGGGVGVGDFNGDGLEDVYLSANQSQDKLFLNKGDLKFEDITESSGIIKDNSWSNGVSVEDINGDGHLDIYVAVVSKYSPYDSHNRLYINNGDATFIEQSKKYNLDFSGYGTHATFLDYDKDGDLDVYLLNHAVHSVRSYGNTEKRAEKDSLSGDRFYENRVSDSGTFVEVTDEVGIYNSPLGYGLAVTSADVNQDGYVDIYVGNDFHENDYLYINNGDKTFSEMSKEAFTHTTQFSMGVDIADINNDGLADIFTTDMLPYDPVVLLKSGGEDTDQIKSIKENLGFENQYARNHLQLNNGNNEFRDVGYATETFATDWSWSVLLQDFDNDRLTDIFISNGIVRRPNDLDYINFLNEYDSYQQNTSDVERAQRLIEAMPSQPLSNILFTQEDGFSFSKLKDSELGSPSFSTGAAYADFDLDGDLDLISNNINQETFLYENTTSSGHYVSFNLVSNIIGVATNGAKVEVHLPHGGVLSKTLQTTRGFMSSSTRSLYFGLGDVSTIDSVAVTWPDGTNYLIENIVADQIITISKKGNTLPPVLPKVTAPFLITELAFGHIENQYFDENNEKLIPERLSMEGPAVLVEDFDGDGVNDIYLGGGRGQSGKIYLGSKDGTYTEKKVQAFENDARYEDVDVALIDFDKDGDKDIYVVSGGNDYNELNKVLEDRLYLNNGKGNYKRIQLSLPHTNGSCVSIADFDNDGYEDIFVGARSIPGSYGLSPYSFILKNKMGQGVDIAYKVRYGMVTDAEWVDLDSDGDQDLVMCGDWMSIKVLSNESGSLTETTDLGLEKDKGLWNTIAFADFNNDGRKEIIAGNAGLNHKWKANHDTPVKLYVGDVDSNGSSDPLIFYNYGGRHIPFSALPKLTSQAPSFRKKFTDYKSYSTVDGIEDLVEDESLIIERKDITELRSMIYYSGKEGYSGQPLPPICQYSTINDVLVSGSSIHYVGNSNTFVADIGYINSNAAGRLDLSAEDGKNWSHQSIPLPADLSYRKILNLEKDKYLASANGNNCYIIENK